LRRNFSFSDGVFEGRRFEEVIEGVTLVLSNSRLVLRMREQAHVEMKTNKKEELKKQKWAKLWFEPLAPQLEHLAATGITNSPI